MKLIEYMDRYEYEQVAFYTDRGAGLKSIIAIHDTTLGPALGGIRMWPYNSEEDALMDVLRLARAMTYKSSAAGLPLGGGKAVIIGDPRKDKSEALFRSFGRFVESLGGRYITTEDVGSAPQDMEWISWETTHVTGLPVNQGGSGDPSIVTAYGVYQGMKACAKEVFGSDSLEGRRIALQGFGKVSSYLAPYLKKEKARIIATDINEAALERAKKEIGATAVEPDRIYDVECDIFSPNALGGVLNDKTIPRIKAPIVAGPANNQLLEDRHGEELQRRGILYAPDYIINAGGVINISFELTMYDQDAAMEKTGRIYNTLEQIFAISKAEGISTAKAADRLAEERIQHARRVRHIYL
ncbi:MAG: Glu/Leu/Phe/Val dehydrogenase [Chloroflexi bacterium]|nr:Glu/Leu/Phe/Val dehydrogenase [Chloroflexota bacterium]